MTFKKAVKSEAFARVALVGPSGSGKTYTGLALAQALVAPVGGRIAVVDTEGGSSAKYAGLFDFDKKEPDICSPAVFVALIKEAEKAGYHCLLIDSLSHEWMGRGGVLEMVDVQAAREKGNKFTPWRTVTPEHQALVDAILRADLHIIATLRTKTEWVIEEGANGKKVPRKIGLAPVQRGEIEYEFDIVGEIDHEHVMTITKTRCSALDGRIIHKPGAELGTEIVEWLKGAPREKNTYHTGKRWFFQMLKIVNDERDWERFGFDEKSWPILLEGEAGAFGRTLLFQRLLGRKPPSLPTEADYNEAAAMMSEVRAGNVKLAPETPA